MSRQRRHYRAAAAHDGADSSVVVEMTDWRTRHDCVAAPSMLHGESSDTRLIAAFVPLNPCQISQAADAMALRAMRSQRLFSADIRLFQPWPCRCAVTLFNSLPRAPPFTSICRQHLEMQDHRALKKAVIELYRQYDQVLPTHAPTAVFRQCQHGALRGFESGDFRQAACLLEQS